MTIDTCLSPNAVKMVVFGHDSDFLASIDIFRALWGLTSLQHKLWNTAALLVKPDAIALKNVKPVIFELRAHGLIPIAFRKVLPSHSQVCALWKYQANVSTPQRLRLLNEIMRLGPSIFVLLLDLTVGLNCPAAVHLTYLKGPTLAERRRKGHLRSIAGPPLANVLSYLHASDDPADIVREISVLFDRSAQIDLLTEADAAQDRTNDLIALVNELESAAITLHRPPRQVAELEDISLQDRASRWNVLVREAKTCRSFVGGEVYRPEHATVPDDKRLSLPIDWSLVRQEFGKPY